MIEINLLPWREQLKRESQIKQLLEVSISLLLAAFVWLILHCILNWQLETLKVRSLKIQENLEHANQSFQALQKMYQELGYQKLPDLDLNLIFHHQEQILDFLRKIANLQPKDLSAHQISLEGSVWKIAGVARGMNQILHFSEALKSSFTQENLSLQRKKGLLHYQLHLETRL